MNLSKKGLYLQEKLSIHKMKNLKNLWIVAAAVVIGLTSCYKESPVISFNTKRDRLANEWIVTEYQIDGQSDDAVKKSFYIGDSIALVLNITRNSSYGMNMQYTKEYSDNNGGKLINLKTNFTNRHYIDLMTNLSQNNVLYQNIGFGGKWTFMDKFRKVEFGNNGMGDLSKPVDSTLFVADIVMLKNKNLKLKYKVGDKTHTVAFEPLNKEIVK